MEKEKDQAVSSKKQLYSEESATISAHLLQGTEPGCGYGEGSLHLEDSTTSPAHHLQGTGPGAGLGIWDSTWEEDYMES